MDNQNSVWLQTWIENNRWWLLLAVVGIVFMGIGIRRFGSEKEQESIQIISSEEAGVDRDNIVVDVSGSVNIPGVYELPFGGRIADAIEMAGGLSEDADQEYVEKGINRAQLLKDGQKIYIVSVDERTSTEESEENPYYQPILGDSITSSISINSASFSDLESLWGIGKVTAQTIIDGRPYSSVEELVDKKIIKSNVWERNKDKLGL